MPIKIPDDLPAARALEAEGVVVMRETDAVRQDIRPLRIGLLNLMPNKISTETQVARLREGLATRFPGGKTALDKGGPYALGA